MPSPIRLLTISKPYVAAAYRHKLALLQERGFEVGLICPPAWGSQRFEGEETRFWTRQVPIALNGKNHFHLYRGLQAAVKDFAPDVLNVEEEHYSAVTWQAFRIARKVGAKPLFYTWQNIHKTYPPPFHLIERFVFAHAAAGVGGNAESLAILRAKGFKKELALIPQMGVELARFAPDDPSPAARAKARIALGLAPAKLWLCFAGRVVEEKGVQDVVNALAAPALADVRLLILGDGPYAPALMALAESRGVSSRIERRAAVPSTEVPRFLRAVDALVLPSHTRANWKEQFGRVLVEAMAAEAVVVGSDSGEIPHVIGDAGLVHREGDVPHAVETLHRLAAEDGLAETCRTRGRRRVRDLYTNDLIADALAALVRRL